MQAGGRNKFFKGANNAWGEQESPDQALKATPALPGLNSEQSKQLLQFIANLTTNTEQRQSVSEATASACHMAGIIHVLNAVHSFCAMHKGAWILDSGASEHMSSDRQALHGLNLA